MNLIGTILVYTGLAASVLGVVSLLKPLTFLGIVSRSSGLLMLGCGIVVFLIGEGLPVSETQTQARQTGLDEYLPVYQFEEFHSIHVHASRERVFKAIQEVSADEISLFTALTWARRFGQSGQESILNAPSHQPLLAVALRTGFMKLAEEQDREIVLGTLVVRPPQWRPNKRPTADDFKELSAAGFAVAAINFRIQDKTGGFSLLTTETRAYAMNASARRKFAAYWRVIYPGSALIRVMWLRAIRHRAEMLLPKAS
jgi:hypothetical protein